MVWPTRIPWSHPDSGLDSRYADAENGGWFSSLDPSGNVIDSVKANYAHALLATASAVAAGIPGADSPAMQLTPR